MSSKDLKKLGNNAFIQEDYNSSVDYYKAYLKINRSDSKIQFKIAESYRKTRDYEKASSFYLKSYESSKNSMALYYYADTQRTGARYRHALAARGAGPPGRAARGGRGGGRRVNQAAHGKAK